MIKSYTYTCFCVSIHCFINSHVKLRVKHILNHAAKLHKTVRFQVMKGNLVQWWYLKGKWHISTVVCLYNIRLKYTHRRKPQHRHQNSPIRKPIFSIHSQHRSWTKYLRLLPTLCNGLWLHCKNKCISCEHFPSRRKAFVLLSSF